MPKQKKEEKTFVIRYAKSGFHVWVRLFGSDRGMNGRLAFSREEWELFAQAMASVATIQEE